MIQINLLPAEYRKKSGTPIKLLMTVFAVVTINSCLAAWLAWKTVGEAAEVGSELAHLTETMGALEPQIDYHKELENENKQFESREKTLHEITSNRISWTQKLDQLVNLIHEGGDGGGDDDYLIWLDDVQVAQVNDTRNKKQKSFGELSASGHSGSPSFANVATFFEDIKAHEICEDFFPPSHPEGSQTQRNDDLVPDVVISFPLELQLRPPDERGARKAAAAAAAEAAAKSADKGPAKSADKGAAKSADKGANKDAGKDAGKDASKKEKGA